MYAVPAQGVYILLQLATLRQSKFDEEVVQPYPINHAGCEDGPGSTLP